LQNIHFGFRIYSNLGTLLTDASTWCTGQVIPFAAKGPGAIEAKIDFLNLMPGTYYLSIWAASFHEWQDLLHNVAKLDIEPSNYYGTGRGIEARFGLMFLPYRWAPSRVMERDGIPMASALANGSAQLNGVSFHTK
jgi:hypothetical protein